MRHSSLWVEFQTMTGGVEHGLKEDALLLFLRILDEDFKTVSPEHQGDHCGGSCWCCELRKNLPQLDVLKSRTCKLQDAPVGTYVALYTLQHLRHGGVELSLEADESSRSPKGNRCSRCRWLTAWCGWFGCPIVFAGSPEAKPRQENIR